MSYDIERSVEVHCLILDHHLQEEIYERVDQIADPNNPLCDINEAHCRVLGMLFGNYN